MYELFPPGVKHTWDHSGMVLLEVGAWGASLPRPLPAPIFTSCSLLSVKQVATPK